MTKKQFEQIARRLAPDLPGFVVKAPLVFVRPVRSILRGLCFETSSYDKRFFYLWVFAQPLFVPAQYLAFSIGHRLRLDRSDRWNADMPDLIEQLRGVLREQASPFLAVVNSPRDLADISRRISGEPSPYVCEAAAYASILIGDYAGAVKRLHNVVKMLDESIPWQRETADRARLLIQKLQVAPEEARQQLSLWERETVRNLGLAEFWVGEEKAA